MTLPIVESLMAAAHWVPHDEHGNEGAYSNVPYRAAGTIEELYDALTTAGNALVILGNGITDGGSSGILQRQKAAVNAHANAAFVALAKARGES
jgi:hypothetical protein